MSNKKPVPDGDVDPRVRDCLACRRPFTSTWAGERICKMCKDSHIWRTGGTPYDD